MRLIFLFLFSLNLFALDIDDLRTSFEKDGAFVAGKILSKLNNGLHFLEKERDFQNSLLIAIHGRGTEGYEWVYVGKTKPSGVPAITMKSNGEEYILWKLK